MKQCKWKGKEIACSSIFRKVATDNGICCGFNIKEADKIFAESRYTTLVTELETTEKKYAIENSSLPLWYIQKNEPKSQAGTNMGLTVVLDAHSDQLSEFSISSDFQGFTASIFAQGDFPLTHLNEFQIKPGYFLFMANFTK